MIITGSQRRFKSNLSNSFHILKRVLKFLFFSFLLQTEHAQTYSELLLEEQRFWIAVHQIEMRSSIVLDQVFPRFAGANVSVGESLTEAQIEKIVGIDVVHKLKLITAGIIENVDQDVESLRGIHDQFRASMKKIYPKKK